MMKIFRHLIIGLIILMQTAGCLTYFYSPEIAPKGELEIGGGLGGLIAAPAVPTYTPTLMFNFPAIYARYGLGSRIDAGLTLGFMNIAADIRKEFYSNGKYSVNIDMGLFGALMYPFTDSASNLIIQTTLTGIKHFSYKNKAFVFMRAGYAYPNWQSDAIELYPGIGYELSLYPIPFALGIVFCGGSRIERSISTGNIINNHGFVSLSLSIKYKDYETSNLRELGSKKGADKRIRI